MMKRLTHSLILAAMMSTASFGTTTVMITPAVVAQDDEDEGRRRSSAPSLDANVAKVVQEAINITESEPPQYSQAIQMLNDLEAQRGDRFKPYDRAIVNQVRGGFKAQTEDYRGALRDFQAAIDTGSLPPDTVNSLRYAVAQLQFQLENYDAAIAGLQQWLRTETDPPANAYYLLAIAYIQTERFRQAQDPMERAIRLKEENDKNWFDALNLIYSENNEYGKRAALLERMINIWPEEDSYWAQLAGSYAVNGDDEEAFSVLEVAYRAGLISEEAQIKQLIQYYSFFDNAFRGAKLLEREMAAGGVSRTEDNLILLSQLWDQSREAKKAIPILEEAAESSGKGELFFRLGRVLVADEQWVRAESALNRSIRSGQLNQKDLATAYMLLGNARFSQAGPDDIAQRNRAKEAFQQAARFSSSRRDANRWINYINEVNRVQRLQAEAERERFEQLCEDTLSRLDDARRINQLQGRPLDDLSPALTADLLECGYDTTGNPIPGSEAARRAAEEENTDGDSKDADGETTEEEPAEGEE